jgi:hypothetical protein
MAEAPVRMHEWARGMDLPAWLSPSRQPVRYGWLRRIATLGLRQPELPWPDAHDHIHVVGCRVTDTCAPG